MFYYNMYTLLIVYYVYLYNYYYTFEINIQYYIYRLNDIDTVMPGIQ